MSMTTGIPNFISKQVKDGQYAFLDLDPDENTDFTVVCVGKENCNQSYLIRRNGFIYHTIEYISSGSWELIIEGKKYALKSGDVFAYTPTTKYSLRATSDGKLEKSFILLAGKDINDYFEKKGLLGQPYHTFQNQYIQDIFEQLIDCSNLSKSASQEISRCLGKLLSLRIIEDSRQYAAQHTNPNYSKCRQFIKDNFLSLCSVQEIASKCNISPEYLSRVFKKYANESPYQYLMRLKMDYAANMLVAQNSSVKAVAIKTGFEDPYHFSRVFKKNHGLSPKHFTDSFKRV